MEGGWIKIHRKILEWEWFDDGNVLKCFLMLICTASTKKDNYRGIAIETGQVVTSLSDLSSRIGLSIQQTRTCLNKLISTGEITIKATNKFSIVTICNYDSYQLCEEAEQQANQHAEQQTINKQKEKLSPTPPIKENNKSDISATNVSEIYAKTKNARGGFEYFSPTGERMVFTPPTEQEIAEFAEKNGLRYLIPKSVIERFDKEGWRDRNGRPVDWKAAARKINESNRPKSEEEGQFEKWMLENYPRVQQLREPLILSEYRALESEFGAQNLCDILRRMDNYQKLTTSYVSAKQTARTWLKNNNTKNGNNTWNGNGRQYVSAAEQREHDRANVIKRVAELIEERANSDYDGSL